MAKADATGRYHAPRMPALVVKPQDIDAAFDAAQKVVEVHRRLAAWLRPGQTLAAVDQWVGKTLADLECVSCFRNYVTPGHPPFPAHACLSVNDCIVHGHALYRTQPLVPGDLVKVDIGVTYRGWIGDAGWTYCLGQPTDLQARLMACGKESLRRGIATIGPDSQLKAFAMAVQEHVERDCGFHCVKGLGGHGYGRTLHAAPFVANAMPGMLDAPWPEAKQVWVPGTLVAVEPMIGVGTGKTRENPHAYNRKWNDWPIYTADGSLSVHHEHDVLVTETGRRVLTEGLDEIPDILPA
jgi:methionyl aminopeptidase